MNKIETYNYIKYYFEERFYDINETYYKEINNKLKNIDEDLKVTLNNLYGDEEGKFNSIHNYILQNNININYLYQLIKLYKYNFAHTLLWGIYDICNTDYEKTEEYIIKVLLKSPYIYSINKTNNDYIINCIFGKIPFQKASTYFNNVNNKILKDYTDNYNLISLCHYNSKIVAQNLQNSFIYTGLCNNAFIGTFYHSVAIHNKNCIDLNYKVVMPINIYQNLTNFNLIQLLSSEDIKSIESDIEILNMALQKQIDNKELQKKLYLK